jgi:uncharacterized protein YjbJ (UPF0337 family)
MPLCAKWAREFRMPRGMSGVEMTVKWNRIAANWLLWRSPIQQRWGKLTHVHLEAIAGRRDHLLECIQRVYGLSRRNAERQLRKWENTLIAESNGEVLDFDDRSRESA